MDPAEEPNKNNVTPLREDYIITDAERQIIERFAEKLRVYRQVYGGALPESLAFAMWGNAQGEDGQPEFAWSVGHLSQHAMSKLEAHSTAAGLLLKP